MRTNEERIAKMHARAEEIEKEQRRRRVRIAQSAAAAVSFAAVILLAVFMPQLAPAGDGFAPGSSAPAAPGDMQASIFGGSGVLGYIVIAIIAFLLGAFVTAFGFRLKRWQDKKDRGEDR